MGVVGGGGDRHMRPWTFLYEIQIRTTFTWSFFLDIMRNFGNVEPYIECILPFQYNIIFQPYQSSEPLSSTLGEMYIRARKVFCTTFNSEQLLFEAFFDIMRIFGIV